MATAIRVGIALVSCSLSALASAQPRSAGDVPPNPPAPSPQPASQPSLAPSRASSGEAPVKPVDPTDARARALYKQGDAAYFAGEYADAIAKFGKAYELSGRPELLFNLANAYQHMGRYAEAAERLNNYVSHAPANERAGIRSRIATLRQMAAVQRRERARVAQLQTEVAAYRARDGSGRTWAYAAWVAGGLGLVSGIVFAARADHFAQDALRDCAPSPAGPVCLRRAESSLDDERRSALVADVSFGVAVAAIGVGAYLFWRALGKERRARETQQPRLGLSSTGMDVALRF